MRKVVIVGPPPVRVLDVMGPLEVFSNAPDYEIQLANPGLERSLQTSRGLVLAEATPIAGGHGPTPVASRAHSRVFQSRRL